MEMLQLGSAPFEVSRICLGTWQASGWATSSDENFLEVVQTAIDVGVTFIDTAPAYGDGHSERLLGQALRGKRDCVILATKFLHTSSEPKQLRASLEESLSRLKTDYIDLFQQHWPGKDVSLEDTIAELEKLRDEGKIRAIGVSNWEEDEFSRFLQPERIDSFQPCYNLLWRKIEKSLLPLCMESNIGVIAYSPLCQGLLSGKFHELEDIPKDARKQNVLRQRELFPHVKVFLETLDAVAKRSQKSMAQTALRWVLDNAGITSVIVGCSSEKHVIEASQIMNWRLPEDDHRLLNVQSKTFRKKTAPFKSLWNWHPAR